MKKLALITLLYLLVGVSVHADEFTETKEQAERGYAGSQHNLALMYANGEGVPQDYAETRKWFRKAAEQGFADSQFNLGIMYNSGRGVPQDYAEAVKWFRKAAEQGYTASQFNLGIRYYKGEGGPQDYTEAYVWWSLAATSGHKNAIKNRDRLVKELTPETLNAAQKRTSKQFAEIQSRKE